MRGENLDGSGRLAQSVADATLPPENDPSPRTIGIADGWGAATTVGVRGTVVVTAR